METVCINRFTFYASDIDSMTSEQLRDWQRRMGYTNAEASSALGMSSSGYSQMRRGTHANTGHHLPIERRTALACAALELMRVGRADASVEPGDALPDACRPMLLSLINTFSMGAWRPLSAVSEMVKADPDGAKLLRDYLDTNGAQVMDEMTNALRSMVAREVASRVLGEIEIDEAGK